MNTIPPTLRQKTFLAIYARGIRWAWIENSYAKWSAGAQADQCIEEIRGKTYGLATECRCRGCVERSCFAMFEQVSLQFSKS